MKALRLYAGPAALAHLRSHGLLPEHVACIPAAAGGPKGLVLGRLDRFVFGEWLVRSQQPVDLVGASIGAWRMATACLAAPVAGFERLERDYIAQHYAAEPGRKRPSAALVSATFGANLQAFYGGHVPVMLSHPRYRLHIVTAHGRRWLHQGGRWRTPLGYAAAFVSNAARRRSLGMWLERVVFSSPGAALPFATHDFCTRHLTLTEANFMPALQASCSIPFALEPVTGIPGAPSGCYWDGGITDYHLHLNWRPERGLVLYPHFQRHLVPGWLDKALKWRHRSTAFLDRTLVLAPNPDWLRTLPHGKLPDRSDFERYGSDLGARVQAWSRAASASQQLADEFNAWLQRPDPSQVRPL